MFTREITKKAVIYLKNKLEPEFIYFAYPIDEQDLFDVLYYGDAELDEYEIRCIENEVEAIVGKVTALTNLKYTDTDFADEMVHSGELIYYKTEKKLREYLFSLYTDCQQLQLDRRVLTERLNECGSIYLQ